LASARRVVVKLGSAQVIDAASGAVRAGRLAELAGDLSHWAGSAPGRSFVVVSSGAVALGRRVLGLSHSPLRLEEKQAAAAAGQPLLMRAWADAFAPVSRPVAQALLTPDDTEHRRRWLNARATLETLIEAGAVPVINENDTVATAELRYGDNDRLAARVAQMTGADALVLLSDVAGLYTADPRRDPDARLLPVVRELTPEVLAMGGGANADTGVGSGGMRTKLEAARIALTAGCSTAITDGAAPHVLRALEAGGPATWFLSAATPESARRAWLAGSLSPVGTLVVDAGAARALKDGASLLPAGVTQVEGRFERGDAVAIRSPEGGMLARGITAYSAEDARRIAGHRSGEIEAILGFRGRPALVHRDDLVLS
jgi:glutamate 5-kinase